MRPRSARHYHTGTRATASTSPPTQTSPPSRRVLSARPSSKSSPPTLPARAPARHQRSGWTATSSAPRGPTRRAAIRRPWLPQGRSHYLSHHLQPLSSVIGAQALPHPAQGNTRHRHQSHQSRLPLRRARARSVPTLRRTRPCGYLSWASHPLWDFPRHSATAPDKSRHDAGHGCSSFAPRHADGVGTLCSCTPHASVAYLASDSTSWGGACPVSRALRAERAVVYSWNEG